MKECPSCGNTIPREVIYCPYCRAKFADSVPTQTENQQRHKLGFKMQRCPLCNKKIRTDGKYCSECGWDLTEHELTLLQIARIQEEIQDARFRATQLTVGMVPFVTIALVCFLVGMLALHEVIPATWRFMAHIGFAFMFIGLSFVFLRDRYEKKQERLKKMLR